MYTHQATKAPGKHIQEDSNAAKYPVITHTQVSAVETGNGYHILRC
jgi:hypothetical protein